jgi:hypothetical protein
MSDFSDIDVDVDLDLDGISLGEKIRLFAGWWRNGI